MLVSALAFVAELAPADSLPEEYSVALAMAAQLFECAPVQPENVVFAAALHSALKHEKGIKLLKLKLQF
jgi:hypothetical protein